MKIRSQFSLLARLLCVLLILSVLTLTAFALSDPPSQAGSKVLSGGQRDFAFPVPGHSMLSSCFMDQRQHYALDFPAPQGTAVVASYNGIVVAAYNGCSHNYGKSSSCCADGFGNYVVLEHDYVLKSGEHIILYSRYSHLTKATVSVGQSVVKGQQVGTIGSTGYSTGHHLDYQILYGGWTPFRSYSIDPYINELLELPEGLHSMSSGGCCSRYVAYVKEYYPRCTHEDFNAEGSCTECGYTYDWASTRSAAAMGIYTVNADISSAAKPYSDALGSGEALTAGTQLQVDATVTNGEGESWYALAAGGYLPKSALTFSAYLESEFHGSITSPAEGQTLKKQSHTLSGSVSSLYPLRKVSGYIDGTYYGSWTGSTTYLELSGTDINNKLYFSTLTPGIHTLTVTAADATGREETVIAERVFYIEQPPTVYTVTLDPVDGACETGSIYVQDGHALGTLPIPVRDGYSFTSWYTEAGEAAGEDTVISQTMTLFAKWEPVSHTVTIGDRQETVSHGQTLSQLAQPQREGYIFLGWFTAETGGSAFTPQTPVTDDITLYPHWAGLQYDVTLDPGDGTVIWYTKTVTFGANYGAFPAPHLEGYRFAGWSLNGTIITNTTPVATAKNHTLTALWEPAETAPPATKVPTAEDTNGAVLTVGSFLWVIPAGLALLVGGALVFILLRRRQLKTPAAELPPEEAPALDIPADDASPEEPSAENVPAEDAEPAAP